MGEFWSQCGLTAVGGGCKYLREGPRSGTSNLGSTGRPQIWPAKLARRKCPPPPSLLNLITLKRASKWNLTESILPLLSGSLFHFLPLLHFLLCYFCAFLGPGLWKWKKRPPASGFHPFQPISASKNSSRHPAISRDPNLHFLLDDDENHRKKKRPLCCITGLLVIKWLCSFDCWKFCWHIKSQDVKLCQLWSSYFFSVIVKVPIFWRWWETCSMASVKASCFLVILQA